MRDISAQIKSVNDNGQIKYTVDHLNFNVLLDAPIRHAFYIDASFILIIQNNRSIFYFNNTIKKEYPFRVIVVPIWFEHTLLIKKYADRDKQNQGYDILKLSPYSGGDRTIKSLRDIAIADNFEFTHFDFFISLNDNAKKYNLKKYMSFYTNGIDMVGYDGHFAKILTYHNPNANKINGIWSIDNGDGSYNHKFLVKTADNISQIIDDKGDIMYQTNDHLHIHDNEIIYKLDNTKITILNNDDFSVVIDNIKKMWCCEPHKHLYGVSSQLNGAYNIYDAKNNKLLLDHETNLKYSHSTSTFILFQDDKQYHLYSIFTKSIIHHIINEYYATSPYVLYDDIPYACIYQDNSMNIKNIINKEGELVFSNNTIKSINYIGQKKFIVRYKTSWNIFDAKTNRLLFDRHVSNDFIKALTYNVEIKADNFVKLLAN